MNANALQDRASGISVSDLTASVQVSVIIPCHNCRQFLEECIDSVLALELPSYEVIVVDDGSTEDIRDIVERYAPIAHYIRQEKQGPSIARNTGIQASTGEFILFLDADDYLIAPDVTRRQLALFHDHPGVGLVYGQATVVDARGQTLGPRKPPFTDEDYIRSGALELKDLLFDNYINTCGTIVRRSTLEQTGLFRPGLHVGEDWDLWLRIAQVTSIAHIAEPVVVYRRHDSNTTRYHDVIAWHKVHADMLDRVLAEPDVERRYGSLRRSVHGQLYLRTALRSFHNHQMSTARHFAVRGLLHKQLSCRRSDVSFGLSIITRSLVPETIYAPLRRLNRWRRRSIASLRTSQPGTRSV